MFTQDCGSFEWFTLESIDEALHDRGLRTPFVRMLTHGEDIPTAAFSSRRGHVDGLVSAKQVRGLLREGATLVLQSANVFLPELARICAAVSRRIGRAVNANVYVTPPGQQGAGRHYDFHSVFMRQIHGAKTWTVGLPENRLPSKPWRRGVPTGASAETTLELTPGCCLYLPRGFVHEGWANPDCASVHVTFSLPDPRTWVDVMVDGAKSVALKDEYLREDSWLTARLDDPAARLRDAGTHLQRFQTLVGQLRLDDLQIASPTEAEGTREAGCIASDLEVHDRARGANDS